jgi:hypothetical protein
MIEHQGQKWQLNNNGGALIEAAAMKEPASRVN